MSPTEKITIWIDADACPKPIREVVYRDAFRLSLPVTIVANTFLQTPPHVKSVQVEKGSDVADQYIVEQLKARDMVITTDIPLAALAVEKGAVVLDHRGEVYTEENVRERLSMRDFMKEIRDSGVITGGPAPFGPKDVEHFANALNTILTKLKL